jgi:hypothetical protein
MIKLRARLPLRWIFPIAQLLSCAIAVWPIRDRIAFQPREAYTFDPGPSLPVQISPPKFENHIDLGVIDPAIERAMRREKFRLATPTVLNLPVALIALPYAIMSPTKNDWVPRGMDVLAWRALSWPFVGLPFWWVAGLGIEALVASRHGVIQPQLGWLSVSIGTIVFLVSAMFALVPLCAGVRESDSDFPVALLIAAAVMWMILGGATVGAWILQRRIRSRNGRPKPAAETT